MQPSGARLRDSEWRRAGEDRRGSCGCRDSGHGALRGARHAPGGALQVSALGGVADRRRFSGACEAAVADAHLPRSRGSDLGLALRSYILLGERMHRIVLRRTPRPSRLRSVELGHSDTSPSCLACGFETSPSERVRDSASATACRAPRRPAPGPTEPGCSRCSPGQSRAPRSRPGADSDRPGDLERPPILADSRP